MVSAAQKVKNREGFEQMLEYLNANRSAKFAMGSDYEIKSPTPEAGKRYLTVQCSHCSKTAPLMRDPSPGIELPAENHYFITDCFFCGMETKARPEQTKSRIWG